VVVFHAGKYTDNICQEKVLFSYLGNSWNMIEACSLLYPNELVVVKVIGILFLNQKNILSQMN